MTHQHYSVDMLVAVVVSWACWTWAGRVVYAKGATRGEGVRQRPPLAVVALVGAVLCAAVVGVAKSKA